jgi:hypothetical protein
MNHNDSFERFLEQTALPNVIEGSHREQLKQQLLATTQLIPRKEDCMKRSVSSRTPPILKAAAALLAALVLVGTGWATEKIYKRFTVTSLVEKQPELVLKLPNGATYELIRETGRGLSGNSEQEIEGEKRRLEEVKKLIAEKKYVFVAEEVFRGTTRYNYEFQLEDGSKTRESFGMRLENVSSYEDYVRQHDARVKKAIETGYFRLVNAEPQMVHICRDSGGDEKYKVFYIREPDGKEFGYEVLLPEKPIDCKPKYTVDHSERIPWQEHLDAVKAGRREIVDFSVFHRCVYELTMEDGSKILWSYNGELLTKVKGDEAPKK